MAEQRLVDIAIEMAQVAASKDFTVTDSEQVALWAIHQINGCGFETRGPVGARWAQLISVRDGAARPNGAR